MRAGDNVRRGDELSLGSADTRVEVNPQGIDRPAERALGWVLLQSFLPETFRLHGVVTFAFTIGHFKGTRPYHQGLKESKKLGPNRRGVHRGYAVTDCSKPTVTTKIRKKGVQLAIVQVHS